jgi:uncharacterized protein (TIGR03435 family)
MSRYLRIGTPGFKTGALLTVALAVGMWPGEASGQQGEDPPLAGPTFEVATVKPVPMTGPGVLIDSRIEPAGYTGRYMTLKGYILEAYNIRNSNWLDGAASLDGQAFSITAKAAGPASQQTIRKMLQHLLASRFSLKVHWESREGQVYGLVKSSKSALLRPVVYQGDDPDVCVRPGVGGLEARHCSMDAFAGFLNRFVNLGRPVINMTGIAGRFDFTLKYATHGLAPDLTPGVEEALPSIFEAIQEIGVKLSPQKGPVQILVVDRANRMPTAD